MALTKARLLKHDFPVHGKIFRVNVVLKICHPKTLGWGSPFASPFGYESLCSPLARGSLRLRIGFWVRGDDHCHHGIANNPVAVTVRGLPFQVPSMVLRFASFFCGNSKWVSCAMQYLRNGHELLWKNVSGLWTVAKSPMCEPPTPWVSEQPAGRYQHLSSSVNFVSLSQLTVPTNGNRKWPYFQIAI